jgi:hypothetical protein
MNDLETVQLYLELLEICQKLNWTVTTNDRYDRFALTPNDGPMTALFSRSLHECVGFAAGYLAGAKK